MSTGEFSRYRPAPYRLLAPKADFEWAPRRILDLYKKKSAPHTAWLAWTRSSKAIHSREDPTGMSGISNTWAALNCGIRER